MTPRQKITLGWLLLVGCGALASAQEFDYQYYMPMHNDMYMQYYRGFGNKLFGRNNGGGGFKCESEGFHADPQDCTKFYRCVNYGESQGLTAFEFRCSEGTVYDPEITACNHPWAVSGPCHAAQTGGPQPEPEPAGSAQGGPPPQSNPEPPPQSNPEPPPRNPDLEPDEESAQSNPEPAPIDENNEVEGPSTNDEPQRDCKSEGFFADKDDCKKFYRCVSNEEGGYDVYNFNCGDGTVFDEANSTCNHPENVKAPCGTGTDSSSSGDNNEMSNEIDSGSNSEQSTSTTTTAAPAKQEETTTTTTTPAPSSGEQESGEQQQGSGEQQQGSGGQGSDCNPYKGECESEGFFPHPDDCRKFFRCVANGKEGSYSKYDFECGEGTVFDPANNVCNHENTVQRDCSKSPSSESQTQEGGQGGGEGGNGGQGGNGGDGSQGGDGGNGGQGGDGGNGGQGGDGGDGSQGGDGGNGGQGGDGGDGGQGGDGGDGSNGDNGGQGGEGGNGGQGGDGGSGGQSEENQNNGGENGSNGGEGGNGGSGEQEQQGAAGEKEEATSEEIGQIEVTESSATENGQEVGEGGNGETGGPEEIGQLEVTEGPVTAGQHGGDEGETDYGDPIIEGQTEETQNPVTETEQGGEGEGGQGEQSEEKGQEGESGNGDSGNGECSGEGFYPTPGDCKKFYRCVDNGKGGFTKYEFDCAEGTVFDPEINVCNHERDVQRDCNNVEQQTTTQSSSAEQTTAAPASSEQTSAPGEEAGNNKEETTTSGTTTTTASPSSSESTTESQKESSSSPPPPPNCTPVDPKPAEVNCTKDGYYPDSTDCANFYRCVDWDEKGEKFSVYFFRCPNDTIYDPAINTCNHPENIDPPRDCSSQEQTTTEQGQETTTAGSSGSEGTTEGTTTSSSGSEGTTEGTTTTTTAAPETTTEDAGPPAEQQQTTTEAQQTTTTESSTAAGSTTTAAATTTESTTAAETTEESTKSPDEQSTTAAPEESGTTESSGGEGSQESGSQQGECNNLQEGQHAYICPTGFRRHPKYCNRFYQCTEKEETEINVLTLSCPNNTVFDDDKQQCLPKEEAQKCDGEFAQESSGRRFRNSKAVVQVGTESLCPGEGYFAFASDCQHFVKCTRDARNYVSGSVNRCPDGFVFWDVSRRCELERRVARKCHARNRDVMAWNLSVDYSNVGRRSRQLLRMD